MGFLSSLSGGSQPRSNSFVLQWAEKRRDELRYENEITPEVMFAWLIWSLSTFAKPDPNRRTNKEMGALVLDSAAHFANDSALFELGCYMYFRVDMWLFLKRPGLREEISGLFQRNFISLFMEALGIPNVAELFEQRVGKYGELARSGADAEKYYYYLSQLILRTEDNRKPASYDFDNEPLLIGDFFEGLGLKINLAAWEVAMLPALIKSLEKATNLIK